MENSGEKYKWSLDSTREKFEKLMKRHGNENLVGGDYEFIVRGKDSPDDEFKVLASFDTPDEARDWYDSLGQIILQGGGQLELDRVSKNDTEVRFNKIMEGVNLKELTMPLVYVAKVSKLWPGDSEEIFQFKTKEKRQEWYEEQGRENEAWLGKIEMPEKPIPANPDIDIED